MNSNNDHNKKYCKQQYENVYYKKMDKKMSFWHDISLFYDTFDSNYIIGEEDLINAVYQMVVEIEVDCTKKMEVSKELKYNPIVLDRILKHSMPFNYGALPQTYEDPDTLDPILNINGDADPLDICNVSNLFRKFTNLEPNNYKTGDICQVRIIGIIQIIDSGEADWKMVGIDMNLFDKYSELYAKHHSDIEEIVVGWFKLFDKYKSIEYFDILHENIEIKKKSTLVVNTILSHSIESYNKKFKSIHDA